MTYWDEWFKRRDEQRKEIEAAPKVVAYDEQPWELNRQGKMRWYLHPAKKPQAVSSLISYLQEIPPGSHSGKVHHQGGRVFYVWKGRGYTVVNGVRHDWEEDDLINFASSPQGVTYQHFNLDLEHPARLLACCLNFDETVGVDMGAGLEQLEDCPEFSSQ